MLVAWNGSREAGRAVHDALPFLKKAQQVSVVTIDDVVPGGAPPEAVDTLVADLATPGGATYPITVTFFFSPNTQWSSTSSTPFQLTFGP